MEVARTEAHPARGVLAVRRIRLMDVAEVIGYTPEYLGRVLMGRYPASDKVRSRLAEYLGEPEEVLFRQVVSR